MRKQTMKHVNRGFTLIEVLIVMLIIGLLSAIAYPNYMDYLRRAHRADARAALFATQQWLERAATATGTYPTELPTALITTEGGRYTIGFAAGNTSAAYTLTATPGGAQASDECGSYTLTNTGKRGNNSGEAMAGCW